MIDMKVLRAADRSSQPWKNGGGVTCEVIAYPPGSGLHDFEWRVSIAEVTAAGPFSCFEGVNRVMTILDGTLELGIGSGAPVRLTPESISHAFPADIPTFGKPIGGAVRDLNVMCRRDLWSADVCRIHTETGRRVAHKLAGVTLMLADGNITVERLTSSHDLVRFDAVYTTGVEEINIISTNNADVIFINLKKS